MYLNYKKIVAFLFCIGIITSSFQFCNSSDSIDESRFLVYKAKSKQIQLYWKDDSGTLFQSIQNLKAHLEKQGKNLVFAVNGGMFKEDHSPKGLFIEKQKIIVPLDTLREGGNFYLQPNGVFYLKVDGSAAICQTNDFVYNEDINYATQSGPMLLVNGIINPIFNKDSRNLNIRNGVGILPDNKVVFIQSKEKVTFYEFAQCFKQLGCKNALYLDGNVSRTYLPEKDWKQTDGDFGVIIGISENKKSKK